MLINYLFSNFTNQECICLKTWMTPPYPSRSYSAYLGFARMFLIKEKHRLLGNLCGKDSEEPEGLKE